MWLTAKITPPVAGTCPVPRQSFRVNRFSGGLVTFAANRNTNPRRTTCLLPSVLPPMMHAGAPARATGHRPRRPEPVREDGVMCTLVVSRDPGPAPDGPAGAAGPA